MFVTKRMQILFAGISLFLVGLLLLKGPSSFTYPPLVPRKINASALLKKSSIEKISDTPFIVLIHDFVTDKENEFLKQQADPLLKRSLVVENSEHAVSADRTSSSAFLTHELELFTTIRQRAADFMGTALKNVEPLQVVHYQDGQRYNLHFDYFDRTTQSGQDSIGTQGQRSATFLVYLNTIPEGVGGETLFPKVENGLKIKPQKNMAVFWYDVQADGSEDELTLHGGLPIHEGEKWASNIWVRNPKLDLNFKK